MFGNSFAEWIKTLHSSSSASVRSNQISPRFSLHRGTWQGCPHSPSLPAIFIEPLAAYIHANSHPFRTILASYTPNKCSIYISYKSFHIWDICTISRQILNQYKSTGCQQITSNIYGRFRKKITLELPPADKIGLYNF